MSIIKNYKRFLTESLDPNIKSLEDVPEEVIATAKRIANDFFDRVRKPIFELDSNKGLIFRFEVTEQDFLMIDEDEDLSLDLSATARGKRSNDVTLVFDDKISELFQVTYIVKFDAKAEHSLPEDENLEDDDEDSDFVDEFELNKDEFNHDFDEDEIDRHIGRKATKEVEFLDDDDDDELHEEFNPLKREDWQKAGASVKRGIGILSKEEAIQKGKEIVNGHIGKKEAYDFWMEENPEVAEKFLIYLANHPEVPYPKWSEKLQKWTSNAGIDSDASGMTSPRKYN